MGERATALTMAAALISAAPGCAPADANGCVVEQVGEGLRATAQVTSRSPKPIARVGIQINGILYDFPGPFKDGETVQKQVTKHNPLWVHMTLPKWKLYVGPGDCNVSGVWFQDGTAWYGGRVPL